MDDGLERAIPARSSGHTFTSRPVAGMSAKPVVDVLEAVASMAVAQRAWIRGSGGVGRG